MNDAVKITHYLCYGFMIKRPNLLISSDELEMAIRFNESIARFNLFSDVMSSVEMVNKIKNKGIHKSKCKISTCLK